MWREDRPAKETQWRIAETKCAGSKRGSSGRTQLEKSRQKARFNARCLAAQMARPGVCDGESWGRVTESLAG